MDFKANEIKAGLMIFASTAIFILLLVAIFGINLGEKTKEYHTYLKYIGGIQKGSLVKYGGMDVGYVTEIDLPGSKETKIGIKIKVDEKTPVRINSKAYVTSIGIMADQHIEISTGSPDAALLPPGSLLDSKDVLSFTQMAEPFGELNTQLQELMTRVVDLFNEENRSHLASMLENVDTLIIDGEKQFINIVQNLDALSSHLAALSSDIDELLEKNKGNLNETLAHLESTTNETSKLISDMRSTLTVLENMMTTNSTSLIEIMENFQYASQNLEEFTRIVKERPWLLVRKAAPPQRKIP
ncbi:MAG: MlaD family protein [bacterium]